MRHMIGTNKTGWEGSWRKKVVKKGKKVLFVRPVCWQSRGRGRRWGASPLHPEQHELWVNFCSLLGYYRMSESDKIFLGLWRWEGDEEERHKREAVIATTVSCQNTQTRLRRLDSRRLLGMIQPRSRQSPGMFNWALQGQEGNSLTQAAGRCQVKCVESENAGGFFFGFFLLVCQEEGKVHLLQSHSEQRLRTNPEVSSEVRFGSQCN